MRRAVKLFLVGILISPSLLANDSLPLRITKALEDWSKHYPAEKVFLHTDKSSYIAGENIWYKAYMMLDGAPTFLSQVLYVDLVDEQGKVIEKQMRPVTRGSSAGDIIIPKHLPTGTYTVNAYSLWMLNFKPFTYKKTIRIYNHDFSTTAVSQPAPDFAVHFFPEGGELVQGLPGAVAFYATNRQGLPIEIKGTLKDQNGKQVTTLATAHAGYGKFDLTPDAAASYSATFIYGGIEKTFTLPGARPEGVSLIVNNSNPSRTFVQVNRRVQQQSLYNKLLVVAQMYGKPVYMGFVNFSEDATGLAISKKNLPAGIMHITVFDEKANPLAERLVFVNNLPAVDAPLITDSVSLKARGKNKIRIDLSQFAEPSVSVAVTDAEIAPAPGTEENILSSLLLTSDLKGYIHQPGQYFKNEDPAASEKLDLLMLTHGWRRFRWNDVITQKAMTLRFPVETGISLSGKVTVPQSSKTIANGYVDIITKGEDSTTILSKAVVNDKGEFLVNDLNFRQKATVYLQGTRNSNQNANVDVLLNRSYIDTLRTSENRPEADLVSSSVGEADKKWLEFVAKETEKNKSGTLANITVRTKKRSRIDSLNAEYASDFFQAGQSLELASQHYFNIWQFLREQVNGLVVEGNMNDPNVYFSRFAGIRIAALSEPEEEGTNAMGAMETNGITYYLNEINVSKDVINTIHPSDVALVKVFKGPEGAALGMTEGGIVIYTKKGSVSRSRPGEKGFVVQEKIGYAVTREFFNPDYSEMTDMSQPDERTTVYWNSNLKKDKTGMATVRFYNNDTSRKLKMVVQGVDKNGKMIWKEVIIQ